MTSRLLVIAKEPVAGRVKTRLCPPFSPEEAASLAEESLRDTIGVARCAGVPIAVALEGRRPDWLDVPVFAQRGIGLADRLANAFVDGGCPALLIGMDSPQITTEDIDAAMTELSCPSTDAVLGPAADGGYWCIGLKRSDPEAFRGIPMSVPQTLAKQRERLRTRGLKVAEVHELRDVDTYDDARAVAALAPKTRFARLFATLTAPISP